MRLALAVVMLAAACRGDGRSPDRNAVHPVHPGSAQVQSGAAPAAGGGAAGSGRVDPPTDRPRGDTLVSVPGEVASRVALAEIAHGLARPVLLVAAPGDPRRRLFILEQHAGRIRVLEAGKLSPRPFFTISDLSKGNEQGLLGLAFHPKFVENGRLYVNYTAKDASTHVVEYRVGKDPDAVDPTTRRELLHVEQPYSNHNGGNLAFGPDGKLYVGLGDGGAANDPYGNGQNPKALLGKLVRLDVDAKRPSPEIVHVGLRNPWRFAFDPENGDLYIGDVGQNLWEYVHGVRGGDTRRHNFGWNIVEGNHCFDPETGGGKASCDRSGLTPPLVEYSHEEGCSITGGFVYRGKALPALVGRYFYADYCTGLLRSFVWNDGVVREHWDWKAALDREGVLTQISSFGVDHDGELYIVLLTGSIYKLVPRG